jgi:hypothetical protein
VPPFPSPNHTQALLRSTAGEQRPTGRAAVAELARQVAQPDRPVYARVGRRDPQHGGHVPLLKPVPGPFGEPAPGVRLVVEHRPAAATPRSTRCARRSAGVPPVAVQVHRQGRTARAVSTPLAAPLLAAARLRTGAVNSARGTARCSPRRLAPRRGRIHVPPAGAKGLNLAAADVHVLDRALAPSTTATTPACWSPTRPPCPPWSGGPVRTGLGGLAHRSGEDVAGLGAGRAGDAASPSARRRRRCLAQQLPRRSTTPATHHARHHPHGLLR